MPYLSRQDTVFILDLGEPGQSDTENRITPIWIEQVNGCLDEAERSEGPAGLVTTGTGKFYSNGFDPTLLLGDPTDVAAYLHAAQLLFARMLTLPMPTVAALQGHTYAAGAIFAMAHDTRVMRTDRGFFCLPEIYLGLELPADLVIPEAMAALLYRRMTAQTAHEAILGGRRYGGPEAHAASIVQASVSQEAVLPEAIERAAKLANTRGAALGAMKNWMYRDVIGMLKNIY